MSNVVFQGKVGINSQMQRTARKYASNIGALIAWFAALSENKCFHLETCVSLLIFYIWSRNLRNRPQQLYIFT